MKQTISQSEKDIFFSEASDQAKMLAEFLEGKNIRTVLAIYSLFICAIAIATREKGFKKEFMIKLADSLWETMKKIN